MSVSRSRITGVGSYLPERVVTNHDLAEMVDTSDEWIIERTGIRERRVAADGELTSDLGEAAARVALERAGVGVENLDLIVVATTTPDRTFPATATAIQGRLGMTHGAAFDVQAVCSGFIYGLTVADNAIVLGQAKNALVIGAETFSRLLDWSDRSTCVLFGDGAGAVVLTADTGRGEASDRGVLATDIRSDGRYMELLHTDGGPSSTSTVGHVRMAGNQVFRHAVNHISQAIEDVAAKAGITIGDIDWFVPHQANKRIIDAVGRKLGIDEERVVLTVDHHGNTSAASIPLALSEAVDDGRVKEGDLVVFEALGGGFTWGAAAARM